MIPTEHEYTLATHAAAEQHYADIARAAARMPSPVVMPPWTDLDIHEKRGMLESVLPIVNAAISALPDRLEQVRAVLRLLDSGDITPQGRRILEKVL